ncbi:MAG: hypothetical protein ACKO5R_05855 [Planctomycetaceae bacterium]
MAHTRSAAGRSPWRAFLVVLLAVCPWIVARGQEAVQTAAPGLVTLATFDVDATPPVGGAMAYGPAVKEADLPLRCRGIVLSGAGEPIVLCAIDWIGVGNAAHDAFRAGLAEAAGTTPARVAVHALHQHDAPHADFTAERLLGAMGIGDHPRFDGDFHRAVIARAAAAIRESLPRARPVTHAGFGRAEVHQIASNRRLVGPEGKFVAWRGSATKDGTIRGWPEGTIDPEVAALALFDGDEPLAVVTSYATHPMSYYRTGVPGPDFPGIARFLRSQDLPAALHLHFTGAGGNVAAGKYNDGTPDNRVAMALRLATGMRRAYERALVARAPVAAADVGWGSVPVVLAVRGELDPRVLEEQVRAKPDRGTFAPIDALAFASRAAERHAIDVTCLRVGTARMLHLPGELFVEYQLAARAMRPDLGVFMAAYGDYGPGYIGTAAAYGQGGYEVQLTSSFVGPEAEEPLLEAIRTLLEAPR